MTTAISQLFSAVLAGEGLGREDMPAFLPLLEAAPLDAMAAARTAAAVTGVKPFTCGIINAKSGLCGENCAFCAQSRHFATGAGSHPLLPEDDLLRRAVELSARGVGYMGIVASGGSLTGHDCDRICRAAARIRREADIRLCASLGMLDGEKAGSLRQAGFTSYHHNLETARSHYPAICTTHEYEVRERTVRCAKAAGLRVCSGGIFGLGESWDQRIELSVALASLDVDSIPVNFLTPIAGTPLGSRDTPSPGEALAIIAMLRLMHPGRDIVVCGGRERSLGRLMPLLFSAGANGIMVGDYLTTPGTAADTDFEIMRELRLRPR